MITVQFIGESFGASYGPKRASEGTAMKNSAAILVGIFGSCAAVVGAAHAPVDGFLNRVWVLRMLQGERLPERGMQVATLRFNPDRTVTGTSACNSVGPGKLKWANIRGTMYGTIEPDGTGAGIVTVVGCGNTHITAVSDRFWRLMETAHHWSVDQRGMSVSFADGTAARLISAK